MTWVATAIIGSSLIGALGSNSAANTQASTANNATAAQQAMFQQTEQNVAPWLQAGTGALNQLVAGTQPGGNLLPTQYTPFTMAQFQQDPGYQFQLQQGQNALTNASSLSGGQNSNNLKGLLNFSQGLANTDYQTALNNYLQQFQLGNQTKQATYNDISGVAGSGLSAGLQQGQISQAVGQNIGSNIIGAGNAQAAGTVGVANAINSGIGSAYNNYLQQQYQLQYANAANNAQFGAASGLGGPATAGDYSDRRLKSNVVRVGTHPLGIGIYEYDIVDRRERGVMADEAAKVAPWAVNVGPDGFMRVRYDLL